MSLIMFYLNMVDYPVFFPLLSTLTWDTFLTLRVTWSFYLNHVLPLQSYIIIDKPKIRDKILRHVYDNLSIFREDKKVCNCLLGQGDGCNICLENPRNWSDWERIKSNFPVPCDRTFEFNKVKQNKLMSP